MIGIVRYLPGGRVCYASWLLSIEHLSDKMEDEICEPRVEECMGISKSPNRSRFV